MDNGFGGAMEILVNEYSLLQEHCGSDLPGSYFGVSPASGLGWGGGAALGAKLATPDRPVLAILGDGSHLFGNWRCTMPRRCTACRCCS
jgi:acetolactate synthase I/II/III large subunit